MESNILRVEAIHPHWRGFLRLSTIDGSILHEGYGSKGTYQLNNGKLTVYWEKYSPDVFAECFGTFVHERVLEEIPAIEGIFAVTLNKKLVSAKRITVAVPDSNYEVSLRLNTSDIPTFDQIFGKYEYDSPNLPRSAKFVVDLGANIGLAAVFFGIKYPEAKLLSVEPEDGNYGLLVSNTAGLGDRLQTRHAAAWVKDGFINLQTEGEDGASLDAWGVRTSDSINRTAKVTKCYTLDTLLDSAGFTTVDILKIDIEGAELKVFSEGVEKWLPRINMIIVETHDRFQPGSEEAVRKAISPMYGQEFDRLPNEIPRSANT